LGFSQKVKAKILLENHFNIDIDYKKSLYHTVKQPIHIKGGHNKEIAAYWCIIFMGHKAKNTPISKVREKV